MRYTNKYIEDKKVEIPQVAFEMFAERSIERVSIKDISEVVGLTTVSLYRFYGTKTKLCIEIASRKWREYAEEVERMYAERDGNSFTALQEVEFYLDCYIDLYQNHRNLLKFNSDFDLFILREKPAVEDMTPYYESVKFFREKFQKGFAKAAIDHTIRTDIPEEQVYYGIMYAMLSMASKYAHGTIYPVDETADYTFGLEMQKQAYLQFFCP